MNSLGWWTASVLAAIVAVMIGIAWSLVHWTPERGEPPWRTRLARILLPVLLVVVFLAIAYGASHMFDPVPVPR